MHDLEIELVENSLAERGRGWVAVYPRNTGDAGQIAYATLKALVLHPDLFAEALSRYECSDLLDVAEAVLRIRTISREMDNDEALPELTKMRESTHPEWLRTLAGRELSRRGAAPKVALIDIAEDDRAVCDASSVDAVDPIRDNIAGTRVRYIGEVELIKGKCGVLTGTKRTPEEICVECVEVKIDGLTWAIPCEFPQFTVCDASSVDERPGQDAGAALETIGAIRTVWWEGGVFSTTDKRTGQLEAIETSGRICAVYTIVDTEGQRWMGNNIKFPEVTP